MKEDTRAFITEKVKDLIGAPSCCAEAKAVGQSWLDAVGTEKEVEATQKLITEVEADIVTIDGLIAFAGSETGAQVFGAEKAKEVLAHAEEIKAAGAQYCDCPACAACLAILEKKGEL